MMLISVDDAHKCRCMLGVALGDESQFGDAHVHMYMHMYSDRICTFEHLQMLGVALRHESQVCDTLAKRGKHRVGAAAG